MFSHQNRAGYLLKNHPLSMATASVKTPPLDRGRTPTRLAAGLGLAAAYFVCGRLALLLAIPPGYATAVWPAAGVALAGVILFGNRVWPGILLGSFLVNVWTSLDSGSVPVVLKSVALAASLGLGASIHALA